MIEFEVEAGSLSFASLHLSRSTAEGLRYGILVQGLGSGRDLLLALVEDLVVPSHPLCLLG